MALKPFTQLQHTDPLINRIQSVINVALTQVLNILFLDGQQLTSVTLTAATPTVVNHKLGRPVSNWWITKLNANAVVWESAPSTSTTITLSTSADATVNIWVS